MKKIIIITVLMLLFLLIGCANDSSADQANLSLTVGYYGEDVGATNDLIREVEMEFRRLYPEIELVIEREPYNLDGGENYYTKLAAQMLHSSVCSSFYQHGAAGHRQA